MKPSTTSRLTRIVALFLAIGLFAGLWENDGNPKPGLVTIPLATKFSGNHTRPTPHQWVDDSRWERQSRDSDVMVAESFQALELTPSNQSDPASASLSSMNYLADFVAEPRAEVVVEEGDWSAANDADFEDRLLATVRPIEVPLAESLEFELESVGNSLLLSESDLARYIDLLPRALATGRYRVIDSSGGVAWLNIRSQSHREAYQDVFSSGLSGHFAGQPLVSNWLGKSLCFVPVNEELYARRIAQESLKTLVDARAVTDEDETVAKISVGRLVSAEVRLVVENLKTFRIDDWCLPQTWSERQIVDSYQLHFDQLLTFLSVLNHDSHHNLEHDQSNPQWQHALEPLNVN